MRLWNQQRWVRACACAQLKLCVAPDAASGISRAYPVGSPVMIPICEDPCAAVRDGAARYVLRQPFVAEIPIAVRADVTADRPGISLQSVACAAPQKEEICHDNLFE